MVADAAGPPPRLGRVARLRSDDDTSSDDSGPDDEEDSDDSSRAGDEEDGKGGEDVKEKCGECGQDADDMLRAVPFSMRWQSTVLAMSNCVPMPGMQKTVGTIATV